MCSNAECIAELKEYNRKAEYFLSLDEQARANRAKGLPYNQEDIMCEGERSEYQSKIRANEAYIEDIEFQESIGYQDYEDDERIVRYLRCPKEDTCSGVGFCHSWKRCFFACDETGKRKIVTIYRRCDGELYRV